MKDLPVVLHQIFIHKVHLLGGIYHCSVQQSLQAPHIFCSWSGVLCPRRYASPARQTAAHHSPWTVPWSYSDLPNTRHMHEDRPVNMSHRLCESFHSLLYRCQSSKVRYNTTGKQWTNKYQLCILLTFTVYCVIFHTYFNIVAANREQNYWFYDFFKGPVCAF